jgi:hypothetical protein
MGMTKPGFEASWAVRPASMADLAAVAELRDGGAAVAAEAV